METRRLPTDDRPTVLVVDGDPKGAGIAQALRRRGFDVANATSNAAALKSVTSVRPAAVVVVMEAPPAHSFLALIRELSTDVTTDEIPVIVTHCEETTVIAQTQRIGNVVVLLGDCEPETVANEVDRVLLEFPDGRTAAIRPTFPLTCPKCGELSGMPRSVSTAAKRGTYITLVCEKCAQQWRIYREADTPGIPKA